MPVQPGQLGQIPGAGAQAAGIFCGFLSLPAAGHLSLHFDRFDRFDPPNSGDLWPWPKILVSQSIPHGGAYESFFLKKLPSGNLT